MSDDRWLRDLQDDAPTEGASIAGSVTKALPRRRRTRASIAALIGGTLAALSAASLTPAFAAAVGDVIAGAPPARLDGLMLLALPVVVVLLLRARLGTSARDVT